MIKIESLPKPYPGGKIFLFQAGYAGGCAKSHESFWVGAVSPKSHLNGRVMRSTCYGMSLLANAFNQGLTHALNLRVAWDTGRAAFLEGDGKLNPYPRGHGKSDFLWEAWRTGFAGDESERIDYFAMLHDDIVPDDDWLTVLHDEMIRSGADLLSTVVPLKDHKALTSTAIDDPNDRWWVERRLTMSEVCTLPETFSSADCGYPGRLLLANSGCWIVRLDLPFIQDKNPDGSLKLRFSIDDRVIWDATRNSYLTQTASEDWEFSRDFGAMGGKVLCTRKVKLSHVGAFPYDNRDDWGSSKFDEGSASKFGGKPIDGGLGKVDKPASPEGWSEEYPTVRGWLRDVEGELLAELAEGKNVLEVGTYCGLSTMWLLRTANKVSCVDTFDGRGTPSPASTLSEFVGNLERHHPDKCSPDKVTIYEKEAAYALAKLAHRGYRFDLVFVDGAHDFESVFADAGMALSVLTPGGLLAFHDFGDPSHPEVTKAIEERLLSRGAKLVARSGNLGVVDPSSMQAEEKGAVA